MDDTLLELQEHCAVLSQTLAELSQTDRKSSGASMLLAADWLNLASGVCNVEILTGRFDDSLMYCGMAREFEDARSELLTRLATQLSIFNFAWGAFETTAKFVNPPSIPPNIRPNGANSLVVRSVYYLTQSNPIEGYSVRIDSLRTLLTQFPQFASALPTAPYPPHMTIAGSALDFVRKVRNEFAHGSASFPYPDDVGHWCGKTSQEPNVIGISTRLVLLTMQMMLLRHYSGVNLSLRVLYDEDGFTQDADVDLVLSKLHTKYRVPIIDG